jgi:hypothetical protein
MRRINLGDVLYRYLPEYQVWHAGIVIKINEKKPYNIHNIYLFEFDDSDCITEVSLYNFLWNRKYFWVIDFDKERGQFGDSVFRSTRSRLETAYDLFYENKLKYTLHKYNCEYFVRRCVFNDNKLWASSQTLPLGQSRIALYGKIATILIFSIVNKIHDDKDFEKSLRSDVRFIVEDGKYVNH